MRSIIKCKEYSLRRRFNPSQDLRGYKSEPDLRNKDVN
jgi:hypothetical protein